MAAPSFASDGWIACLVGATLKYPVWRYVAPFLLKNPLMLRANSWRNRVPGHTPHVRRRANSRTRFASGGN